MLKNRALVSLYKFQIRLDHHADQLRKPNPRFPTKLFSGFCGVPAKYVNFCRANQLCIDFDVIAPIEPDGIEGDFKHVADTVGFTGGQNVVIGFCLLQHEPHRIYVVSGESPIALRVEISHQKFATEPATDSRNLVSNFSRNEL